MSSSYIEAIKYGIDVHLIDENLSLSVEERIQQHQSALDLVFELDRVRESVYSKPESAPKTSN